MAFDWAVGSAFLLGSACGAGAVWLVLQGRAREAADRLEAALEERADALWRLTDDAERTRRDIAAAEARAEAGAEAEAKFLATVTHEMRTPLSGVIGTIELLLETPLAPDQRTYARAIGASADAMLSLVDEILDVSRMEAGKVVPAEAPFDLAELVEGVAELLAPRAHAKGLDLAAHVAPGAPATAVGDAARIRQVLMNLVGNAIKVTVEGGVGIRAETRDDELRFAVVDTGPGFEPSEAEALFEEFRQAEAGERAGGAGLGLTISRRLAEAMGGSLRAEATPGRGARFLLALPRSTAESAAAKRPAPLAGRRVAVASLAPFGGPWMVESFQDSGADAALIPTLDAGSIEAATRETSSETVVIETSETGEAAEALAAAARAGGAARVLLIVAPAERARLPSLAADGFDGYIVKPVRAASLLSRLQTPHADPAAAVRLEPAPVPHGGRPVVLIAEDDSVSALIALGHLSRLGHGARHVGDGLAACEAFEADDYDVAVLDIRMPGLDGLNAARRMRAFEAASGRPRALLIALSANVAAADREAAIEAGFDALIGKPLDRKALEALIQARRGARAGAA